MPHIVSTPRVLVIDKGLHVEFDAAPTSMAKLRDCSLEGQLLQELWKLPCFVIRGCKIDGNTVKFLISGADLERAQQDGGSAMTRTGNELRNRTEQKLTYFIGEPR